MEIAPVIQTLAGRLTDRASSAREAAVWLHDFVRDGIRFGPTLLFDDATPQDTLGLGTGHCNPQSHLLTSLCQSVGIPARMHFVLIRLGVLRGLIPSLIFPQMGHHAYVEIDLDGRTRSVDSFIIDRPLFVAATERLRKESRTQGYGLDARGTVDWGGQGDAFSQFVCPDEDQIADGGAFEDPAEFYASERYANKIAGLRVSQWLAPSRFFLGPQLPKFSTQQLQALRSRGIELIHEADRGTDTNAVPADGAVVLPRGESPAGDRWAS